MISSLKDNLEEIVKKIVGRFIKYKIGIQIMKSKKSSVIL